jgi:hypothetical protein
MAESPWLKDKKIATCLLTVSLFLHLLFCPAARAFESKNVHENLLKEALGNSFNQGNLKIISKYCENPDDPLAIPQKNNLARSIAFVDRQQKKILNLAREADQSSTARYLTLKNLGLLLRTVQDFYSLSDYVESQVVRSITKNGRGGFNPYQIELIDWPNLIHGSHQEKKMPIDLGPAVKAKESEEDCTVIDPSSKATYFGTARELALRDSQRQWDVLSTLIANRYPKRALTILTALKEATVDKEPKEDDLDLP